MPTSNDSLSNNSPPLKFDNQHSNTTNIANSNEAITDWVKVREHPFIKGDDFGVPGSPHRAATREYIS
jgi:hypothetical protein